MHIKGITANVLSRMSLDASSRRSTTTRKKGGGAKGKETKTTKKGAGARPTAASKGKKAAAPASSSTLRPARRTMTTKKKKATYAGETDFPELLPDLGAGERQLKRSRRLMMEGKVGASATSNSAQAGAAGKKSTRNTTRGGGEQQQAAARGDGTNLLMTLLPQDVIVEQICLFLVQDELGRLHMTCKVWIIMGCSWRLQTH